MVKVGMVFPNDMDALSGILVSCRILVALGIWRETHCYGIKNLLLNNVFYMSAGATLLTLYARCGRLHDAKKMCFTEWINLILLLGMPSTMVKNDLVSWNTIIGGFRTHGLGQAAVKLLQEMSVP